MNEAPIVDFPKIKSPFVRKTINGHYIVTPEIAEGYEWVFEDNGVKAVDKLHGTNICCLFKNGVLMAIDNRTARIIDAPHLSSSLTPQTQRILQGILFALEKKWIPQNFTGRLYGELVGTSFNGDIHMLGFHCFVPFDYLESKCHWKSWISNKYPKNFESISEWFKGLTSLFSERLVKTITLTEGLVFYHPDGRMAKLRRDMFDWYYE